MAREFVVTLNKVIILNYFLIVDLLHLMNIILDLFLIHYWI